jgi:hypothetical protein
MDPYAQYLIDGALELGDITAIEHACLSLVPGCAAQVLAAEQDRTFSKDRLRNIADAFLSACGESTRRVMALMSIEAMGFGLDRLREAIEFSIQEKAQADLGLRGVTSEHLRRMLQGSERNTSAEQAGTLFHTVDDINPTVISQWVGSSFQARISAWVHNLALAQDAVEWARSQPRSALVQMRDVLLSRQALPDEALGQCPAPGSLRHLVSGLERKERSKALRAAKSAVKKATKLFERLGKAESVRLMVSGQEVTLSHAKSPFKFVLKPDSKDWLLNRTMDISRATAPFSVHLLTKDDVYLSRLCVYFDETPVLDQLLSFTMFIESGDELALLERANYFGAAVSDLQERLSAAYPALQERFKKASGKRSGALEPRALDGIECSVRLPPEVRLREAHWEPYKGPVHNWVGDFLGQRGLTGRRLQMCLQHSPLM